MRRGWKFAGRTKGREGFVLLSYGSELDPTTICAKLRQFYLEYKGKFLTVEKDGASVTIVCRKTNVFVDSVLESPIGGDGRRRPRKLLPSLKGRNEELFLLEVTKAGIRNGLDANRRRHADSAGVPAEEGEKETSAEKCSKLVIITYPLRLRGRSIWIPLNKIEMLTLPNPTPSSIAQSLVTSDALKGKKPSEHPIPTTMRHGKGTRCENFGQREIDDAEDGIVLPKLCGGGQRDQTRQDAGRSQPSHLRVK